MKTPTPNYAKPVADALARTPLRSGSVNVLQVMHDDWCEHWRGGRCDCAPEVRVVEVSSPEDGKTE